MPKYRFRYDSGVTDGMFPQVEAFSSTENAVCRFMYVEGRVSIYQYPLSENDAAKHMMQMKTDLYRWLSLEEFSWKSELATAYHKIRSGTI